jgi:hypothetical protein
VLFEYSQSLTSQENKTIAPPIRPAIRKEKRVEKDHMSHIVFILFLFLVGGVAMITLGIKGLDYYLTPMASRAFRADYSYMKPSGIYSHSLGIFGAIMVIVGVAMYSSRKRMRSLWKLGRLSRWLEIHIFLCLIGPILIVYHTTFKAGGIAAISLWAMTSVVASGVVGRFLYVLIPRNLNGNELTMEEIDVELQQLSTELMANETGKVVLKTIDDAFIGVRRPKGLLDTFGVIFQLQRVKTHVKEDIQHYMRHRKVERTLAAELMENANARASLLQKSMVLNRVERLFYYWHAIHLPFTIIMFVTLALHVTVAILLGYRWIF